MQTKLRIAFDVCFKIYTVSSELTIFLSNIVTLPQLMKGSLKYSFHLTYISVALLCSHFLYILLYCIN